MARKNSKGQVILGRNMDLDISQNPVFVYKTTFGKLMKWSMNSDSDLSERREEPL